MRQFESPYTTDWFAISLRWLTLFGLLMSLSFSERLGFSLSLPLAILALWNILLTVLAALNARMRFHRQISILIDFLLAGLFFWMQGGLTGSAAWAGILPILTASVYFEMAGALLVAALVAALEIVYAKLLLPASFPLPSLFPAGATLLLGALFGYLGRQLISRFRERHQAFLELQAQRQKIKKDRIRAIYELTSTMTATLSYRRVLETALDLAFTALNPESEEIDDRLVSAVMLFKGNRLIVKSARRFTNADMRVTLPGAEGILGKVIAEGESVLTKNVGYDPELSHIVALRTCTSAYCLPLRSGFSVYGALLFAHPDPSYFTDDRREILEIISRQAVIAIQNARLYQDLAEEKERMVEVQEEARKKLARDLHDGPTQSISAIAMRIDLTRRILQKDVNAADAELVKIGELARRTTKEIRHMLFTLRPLVLESQGLKAALEAMATKMKETFNQNVVVDVDEKVIEQLEMGKQGVIFFISEEAVNNARKHAKAETILIRLRQLEPGLILLEIKDNGVGFDVASVTESYDQRGSLGMINLTERTELVNGLLHIDSAPGKGTNVQVFIPLTEDAADRLHHRKP